MSFANYETLLGIYSSDRMNENIRILKDFDAYHCLLAGNAKSVSAVKQRIAGLPGDFLKWLEVCDGGMLFDTTMLATKSHDAELDLDFETYAAYYNAELREGINLSNDWFVFAVAIHADVFFFDMGKKDGKVYQWDVEEQNIYAYWDTFEDWLSDQIREAIELIAEKKIEPLGVKLEAGDNG
jgi:hypothetical protein